MPDGRVLEPRHPVGVIIDGSFESLMTVVYDYYYEKLLPLEIYEESAFQQSLETDYITIAPDPEKAAKVCAAIQDKLSADSQSFIYMAMLSHESDKLFSVFQYTVMAFKYPGSVDNSLQTDFVLRVHKLAKNVGSEAHLLKGFTRFRKTADGIFYADISPKNNVMPILCEHFQDRLSVEKWVIHDVKRNIAGIYDTSEWVITETPENFNPSFAEDGMEQDYQALWKAFYNTIGIKERVNSKLRRQLSPKYFWAHMTEHNSIKFH